MKNELGNVGSAVNGGYEWIVAWDRWDVRSCVVSGKLVLSIFFFSNLFNHSTGQNVRGCSDFMTWYVVDVMKPHRKN